MGAVKNLSLGKKLFLSPALLMLFMVLSGVCAFWGLNNQNRVIDDMYNNRFGAYRSCAEVMDNSLQVQTDLYKLLGWANAKYDSAKIEALAKEQTVSLKATADALKKLHDSPKTSAEEKKLYQETMKNQAEYAKAATDMMDMLQADLNAATMFMGTAEEKYQVLGKSLAALIAHQQKISDASFKSSNENYRKVLLIFASVLVVAIIISIIVSFAVNRTVLSPVSRTVTVIEEIAAGDLTKRIDVDSNDEIGQMAQHFNGFADRLHDTVSNIASSATQVASASQQLLSVADRIATGAEEVAAQVGTVATAGEEMSATSGDIAQNCQMAAQGGLQASSAASSGAEVVDRTVQVMHRIASRVQSTAKNVESLGSRSDQIGAIIGTIQDIADQTNLLALNAAIEAARAGEQGRGFAVVADEVRALAERTTKATREISEMIKAIQNETKSAVAAMEEGVKEVESGTEEAAKSGQALQDILEQINAVTMQVNQVATAAEEQTATTAEISNNIHQITEVVQGTANGAQESATAASRLAGLANDLQQLVGQFKL
ncbi:methyl-accepting chemotaxis protein [Geobacter pelophilus]|uniref:Methyl-accepting chemotaxis protein n=1 Tax=Geoanaerobacter pelophilus TaxID=60036 RepID=A0AAW4L1S1_9BACT|nr:methyl-accepting chemotaxis protein [Geoanaerobacter pelophilus]MBT0663477.1 methyl-accepting chemotaxis protein [Geoanaerobacter pelophilus]